MVEILQLVHEISSFPEVLNKRGEQLKIDDKDKQSSGGVLSIDVLKNFAKFTEKHLYRSLFFNKVAGWKSEIVRSSGWRCSVKKRVLKKLHWCFRTSRSRSFKIGVIE